MVKLWFHVSSYKAGWDFLAHQRLAEKSYLLGWRRRLARVVSLRKVVGALEAEIWLRKARRRRGGGWRGRCPCAGWWGLWRPRRGRAACARAAPAPSGTVASSPATDLIDHVLKVILNKKLRNKFLTSLMSSWAAPPFGILRTCFIKNSIDAVESRIKEIRKGCLLMWMWSFNIELLL